MPLTSCFKHPENHDPECAECALTLRYRYGSVAAARPEYLTLDPNDPFDKVVINTVSMNRKKRRDYAADSDPFSNFRDTARNMALEGFSATEAAYALLLTKISRLRSLRANGRMEDTANESVLDTYLDLAVYSVIVLALVTEQEQASGPQQSER